MKEIIFLNEKVEIYPIDIKAFNYYKSTTNYCENVDLIADILELEPEVLQMDHIADCMLQDLTLEQTIISLNSYEEGLAACL